MHKFLYKIIMFCIEQNYFHNEMIFNTQLIFFANFSNTATVVNILYASTPSLRSHHSPFPSLLTHTPAYIIYAIIIITMLAVLNNSSLFSSSLCKSCVSPGIYINKMIYLLLTFGKRPITHS